MLKIASLTVLLGKKTIIKDLSLTLDAGEMLILLGKNGSGKTTLLATLIGALPFCGTIHLLGQSLATLSPKERARILALVPQKAPRPAALSVRELILLGRYATLSWPGLYRSCDYEVVEKTLAQTGLTTYADRDVRTLSGGEYQRVLLAMALAQEPKILLLDELSAGLDLAAQIELFTLLDTFRQNGNAIIAVMHDFNLAASFGTRLAGLKDGGLLFDGPPSQTFSTAHLSALYDLPISVSHLSDNTPMAYPALSHRSPSPTAS